MNYSDLYDYYDYSMGGGVYDSVSKFFTGLLLFLLVIALVALAGYLLKSFGLYTLGKRRGKTNAWLAFVPFARVYFQGELSGDIKLKKKTIQKPGIWLIVIPIAGFIINFALYMMIYPSLFGMGAAQYEFEIMKATMSFFKSLIWVLIFIIIVAVIQSAITSVITVLMNKQIFERFEPKNVAIMHAVLCTIVPFYEAIYFFIIRNKPYIPGMEPPVEMPRVYPYDFPPQYGYPGYGAAPGGAPNGYANPGANPQGGMPNGVGRPGAAPQGGMPNGAGRPGAAPQGGMPNGAGRPGAAPQGGMPNGAGRPGAAPQGGMPNGVGRPGAAPQSGMPNEAGRPGAAPQGGMPNEAGRPGAAPQGGMPNEAGRPGEPKPEKPEQ